MTLRAANSANGLIITPTTGTLTIASGKTLTASNSITLAGTDGTTLRVGASSVGTANTGVTAVEYGDGYQHTTVLTVNSTLPAIAGGAALGVGTLLYTLPAGVQVVEIAYMSMGITQTTGHINANTPNVGLGSVVASGVISTLSGTATFQDYMVGSNAANCTGTATVNTTLATSSPFANIRNAAAAKTIYFNAAATWSASGDPAAIIAGTVTLKWQTMA